MKRTKLEGLLEAILFIEAEPLTITALQSAIGIEQDALCKALSHLQTLYKDDDSGLDLINKGDAWQLKTNPVYFEKLCEYEKAERIRPLSEAALEVLAVVAYTQPCTRDTIRSIRGVNSDSILSSLITKGLIKEVRKAEAPSSARLYGTTPFFLDHFGLASISELPSLESFSTNQHAKEFIKAQLQKHTTNSIEVESLTVEDE